VSSDATILIQMQQLRAATTSVPIAQKMRRYFFSLFVGYTGFFTVCSLMLIAAAWLGYSIASGQYGGCILICCCHYVLTHFEGDHLFGFRFDLNSVQKAASCM
jgi:hypothetical protein